MMCHRNTLKERRASAGFGVYEMNEGAEQSIEDPELKKLAQSTTCNSAKSRIDSTSNIRGSSSGALYAAPGSVSLINRQGLRQ